VKPSQWVNTAPDDAAPPALLQRIALRVTIPAIDEVWIFPMRRAGAVESTVMVVSTFDPQPDRRRVITAHFTATRDKKGQATVQERMDEHATAPASAVAKIVEGVQRRLGDELSQPHSEHIGGDEQRWLACLQALGSSDGPVTGNR
jgi:hypothetical protein